jgi:hexosaminidase
MRLNRKALFILSLFVMTIQAQTPDTETLRHSRRNLMPVPASVQFVDGRLPVSKSLAVGTKGYADERLKGGVERMLRRLEGRINSQLPRDLSVDPNNAALVIECESGGKTIPSVDENETYTLNVSSTQAVLKAQTVVGALRGLETFLQLLEGDRDGYFIPAVNIQDQPRFKWRGLLIDVGRHYEPMEVLKRNLDAMAALKLNVLHWHLTEDQGFRIESKKFPKLHQLGSDGLYYTQDQAREIIEYARQRGIRVVPEFDMPGHSTSWLVGHPEFGSAPGPYQIERRAGIFEPALDPTREDVYKFLDSFLGEMAALFPDAYLHIGGDENEGKQWDHNPKIQAFMKEKGIKDNHALQSYFNQRLLKILQKHGKRMMGWDEILQPDLPNNVVIQSWRGPASLAAAAKNGYDGILSSGFYIDLMYPASKHYSVEPIPPEIGLTEAQAAHILGGEATMWGEYVSPETIDSRIWPRTAAIAERLWSPRNVTEVNDMYRRLAVTSVQLEELGLTHNRNSAMMLRRLAGDEDVASLNTLVSVLEPVKEYRRSLLRPATMLSPLTGLVDAARADSEIGRQFATMVDGFLTDAPRFQLYKESLTELMATWRDAGTPLNTMMDRSPSLSEARPLANDLSQIGTAGLEALSYLSEGIAPPAQWRDAKFTQLEQAAKPKAALEFAIIAPVRELVVAAGELSHLKETSPAEWRRRVSAIATPVANNPGR